MLFIIAVLVSVSMSSALNFTFSMFFFSVIIMVTFTGMRMFVICWNCLNYFFMLSFFLHILVAHCISCFPFAVGNEQGNLEK